MNKSTDAATLLLTQVNQMKISNDQKVEVVDVVITMDVWRKASTVGFLSHEGILFVKDQRNLTCYKKMGVIPPPETISKGKGFLVDSKDAIIIKGDKSAILSRMYVSLPMLSKVDSYLI